MVTGFCAAGVVELLEQAAPTRATPIRSIGTSSFRLCIFHLVSPAMPPDMYFAIMTYFPFLNGYFSFSGILSFPVYWSHTYTNANAYIMTENRQK
jgi:hypothetical protein